MWLANLAALELHTNQWTAPRRCDRPCAVVLDLDPGAPADVARLLPRRDRAARDRSTRSASIAVVKTSGGKGLHISVPLNGARRSTDDDTKNVRARARPDARGARPEARDRQHGEGEAPGACSSTGARTTGTRPRSARTRCASRERPDGVDAAHVGRGARTRSTRGDRERARLRGARRARTGRRTASTTTRRRSPSTRSLPDAVAGRFRGWNSTAKSRSSPERAAGVGAATALMLAERGCKVVCAAPRDRRRAGADSRHDRRDGPPDHRRGRRRDRGADQPRQGRRGRAHGRRRPSSTSARSTCSSTTPRSRFPATSTST